MEKQSSGRGRSTLSGYRVRAGFEYLRGIFGTAKRWSRSRWAWLGWGLDVSSMQVYLSCVSSRVAVTSEADMKRSCGWDRERAVM
jgi:hypothetical protein